MKTIVNSGEEMNGEILEGIFVHENMLCICSKDKALPLKYCTRNEQYVFLNTNADLKVALGIMDEQEYSDKKAVFDGLKEDFLTAQDRLVSYASKLEW